MSVVVGIDIGGSTTKIVGFREENGKKQLIKPQLVKADDPITSIYGAFGKFTDENGIALKDIKRVMMTGVGSSYVTRGLYGLECVAVPEFRSIGLGGLYVSGLDSALVVSMGTGTALTHVCGDQISYINGSGVGGGTILGLCSKMLGTRSYEHIAELATRGNAEAVDLTIGDIARFQLANMNTKTTASNFGKVSDIATNEDIALGVANMVAETIAMVAVFAARGCGVKDVVLTGNLSTIEPIRKTFESLDQFGVNFIIPENAQFGTVIGAALHDSHKCI